MVAYFRLKRYAWLALTGATVLLIFLYYALDIDEEGIDLTWLIAPDVSPESHLIKCYALGDATPSIDDNSVRKNKSVFFFETSCHNSSFVLNPRQACAVESAANMNPNLDIYVLVPSPFKDVSAEPHMFALMGYPNVKIRHINMNTYFVGTPLEEWYSEGRLMSSRWPNSHASDVLRYATLWKYGGYYVDLDVVLMRSFSGLSNFVGAESQKDVAAGFLAFNYGHPLIHLAVLDLKYKFKGWNWGNNGPGVITRALKRFCRVDDVSRMTKEKCGGVEVLPPSTFYAVQWRNWSDFFVTEPVHVKRVLKKVKDSVAIHVWNLHSKKMNATVGSNQPYVTIAKKFCPRVYNTLNMYF